jgi:hypothetical protein
MEGPVLSFWGWSTAAPLTVEKLGAMLATALQREKETRLTETRRLP